MTTQLLDTPAAEERAHPSVRFPAVLPTAQFARPPVRALVVDDVPSLAELVALTLRIEGWQVHMATTGEDALTEVETFVPDVVVLDRMLPDLSGMQVLRRLRSRHPDLPVVFVTARDSVEDRMEGLAAGADDYVVKPYSLADLVSRLRRVIVRRRPPRR